MTKASETVRMQFGCGTVFATLAYHADGRLAEVYLHGGKTGECHNVLFSTLGRLVTALLRAGKSAEYIAQKLDGAECPEGVHHDGTRLRSCADWLAREIKRPQSA